jgi:hypothetical protein
MKCCEYSPWDSIHNTSFYSEPMNEPNKRMLHHSWLKTLSSDKHFSLLRAFVSYKKINYCEYRP